VLDAADYGTLIISDRPNGLTDMLPEAEAMLIADDR
jgi:hypothetical protein